VMSHFMDYRMICCEVLRSLQEGQVTQCWQQSLLLPGYRSL
jgi:hypothetical protein